MGKYLENGQINTAHVATVLATVENRFQAVHVLIQEYGPLQMTPFAAMQLFDQFGPK